MWADRVSSGEFMDESPDASNPEVTNTRWDYQNTTEGNRLGIAIRTDQALDNFRKEFDNKESEINTSAILMVHAAGHNTTPINKAQNNSGEYGHLNSGVMADGNSVAGQIRTGGTSYLMDKKRSDNQFFVDAIIKRYGAGKQKDNYDDNKSKINNGTKKPAYTKR